jgi:hypothetical protein
MRLELIYPTPQLQGSGSLSINATTFPKDDIMCEVNKMHFPESVSINQMTK